LELLLLRGALTTSLPFHSTQEERFAGWHKDIRSAFAKAVVAGTADRNG